MRTCVKLLVGLMVAALVGVGSIGVMRAEAAAAHYTCAGSLASPGMVPGGTYSSLAMPAGTACLITAPVTVRSPLSLRSDSALLLLGGSLTVWGPVSVGPRAAFGDANNAAPIDIHGPAWVGDGAAFMIGVETPFGPIISHIRGPVTAIHAGTVQIHNSVIGGPVTIIGGGALNAIVSAFAPGFPNNFTDLEDNTISGPVTEIGYGGVWGGVIRDQIHGPFSFSFNHQANIDEWDIGSNVIHGPAWCSSNVPVPNIGQSPGSPSTVYGPIVGNQAATCTSAAA